MGIAKKRTSFALDENTLRKIRRLSRLWDVSQAEVVRRTIHYTYQKNEAQALSAQERLQHYRAQDRVPGADTYLEEVYEDRESWDSNR